MIRVAEFRSSENPGSPKWGRPGDQVMPKDPGNVFDGEVRVRYLSGEKYPTVYRPVEEAVADSIAYNMEAAARNPHVGYSQNNGASPRTSFYEELVKAGGDASKINALCNSDCSAGIAAVLKVAGVPVSADMWTGNAPEQFEQTRALLAISVDGLISAFEQYLMRGDILYRPGHMCVVLDDGASAVPIPVLAQGDVWQRLAPGLTDGTELRAIPKGEAAAAYLPGADVDGRPWVITKYEGRLGWTSSKYLEPANAVVATSNVYVRRFPVPTSSVITVLAPNEELPATQVVYEDYRKIPWYQVIVDYDAIGWVSGRYSYLD